jgi:hypothetical protein
MRVRKYALANISRVCSALQPISEQTFYRFIVLPRLKGTVTTRNLTDARALMHMVVNSPDLGG